jgi:hypothetical protein
MLGAQTLSWDDARGEISQLLPELADALNILYETQPSKIKDTLCMIAAEYNYGDAIVFDGSPYLAGGTAFPEIYLSSTGLPLGIITENNCEVAELKAVGLQKAEIPNAILSAGQFIGLFEAADSITEVPGSTAPPWRIYAGCCNIYAIPNLGTQQNRTRLTRVFGHHVGQFDHEAEPRLIDQLKRLPVFHDIAKNWKVRIIYFANSWLSLLAANRSDKNVRRVTDGLLRRAWKNLARIRDYESELVRVKLHQAMPHGPKHVEIANAASHFFKSVSDVIDGRHPAYVPTRRNSDHGPFGEIASHILRHVTDQDWIICPAYLSTSWSGDEGLTTGYLKLDHIVPELLANRVGSTERRVLDMVSALAVAARRELLEKSAYKIISPYIGLMNHVMFQTPGAGPTSVYMVRFDEKTSQAIRVGVKFDEFYGPRLDFVPSERCAFFRTSVRVDNSAATEMAS